MARTLCAADMEPILRRVEQAEEAASAFSARILQGSPPDRPVYREEPARIQEGPDRIVDRRMSHRPFPTFLVPGAPFRIDGVLYRLTQVRDEGRTLVWSRADNEEVVYREAQRVEASALGTGGEE